VACRAGRACGLGVATAVSGGGRGRGAGGALAGRGGGGPARRKRPGGGTAGCRRQWMDGCMADGLPMQEPPRLCLSRSYCVTSLLPSIRRPARGGGRPPRAAAAAAGGRAAHFYYFTVFARCFTRRRMRACPRPVLHAARHAPLGLRASSDSSAAQPATSQPPRRASEEDYNRAMQAYSHAPYEYKHEAGLCALPRSPHRLGLTPCAQTFTR